MPKTNLKCPNNLSDKEIWPNNDYKKFVGSFAVTTLKYQKN
jgi:hypothetical protein